FGLSPRSFLRRFPRRSKAARCRNHSRKIPRAFLDLSRCRFSRRPCRRQIRRQLPQKFRRPLDRLSQRTKVHHRTRRPRRRTPLRPYRHQSRRLQPNPHRPEIRNPNSPSLAKISRRGHCQTLSSWAARLLRREGSQPNRSLSSNIITTTGNLIVIPNGVCGVRNLSSSTCLSAFSYRPSFCPSPPLFSSLAFFNSAITDCTNSFACVNSCAISRMSIARSVGFLWLVQYTPCCPSSTSAFVIRSSDTASLP